VDTQNTLRETLADALQTADITPVETPVENVEPAAEPVKAERARDESGKFAKKQESEPVAELVEAAPEQPKPSRPSTWKKDYWEKFDQLDPELQGYINQRESEYKTGVSTYRAEAERAKQLNEAIAPFMPVLQQHNIEPTTWIKNLGTAHQTLALGNPAQKLQMFQQLARDYGVDLGQVQNAPQIDPQSQWLMQQVQTLSQDLNSFKSQQQKAEEAALQSEIQKFAATAPHFEMVRDTMSGLLQAGMATDLQTAYEKAVRLNDEAWQAEQSRLAPTSTQQAQQALKAKTLAVSPKSSSPTGKTTAPGKGLRDIISSQLDEASARV
jgi:hypothetical protein